MPDFFQPNPEWEHFDNSPRDETVPVSGISDAPAHIAIVNQEWVAFVLGAIDRLGYGDVWSGTDADRENAHHQILELQAMLMSPANYLIPSNMVDYKVYSGVVASGSYIASFLVPAGKVYKFTSLAVMTDKTTLNDIRFTVSGSPATTFPFFVRAPEQFTTYNLSGELILPAGRTFQIQWTAGATTNYSCWAHGSYQVFDV